MTIRFNPGLARIAGGLFLAILATSAHAYLPEWSEKSWVSVSSVTGLRSGDLNGDGRPDLLVRKSASVYVMLTNSDGTLGSPSLVYTGTTLSDALLIDLNSDGHLDIVVADTGTNTLVALPGIGDGTFGAAVLTSLSIVPTQLGTGDFNGDSHPDVLIRTSSGPAIAIYSSGGGFQFSPVSTTSLTSSPYRAVVGDIDGDGKADVLIGCGNPNGFQVFFGKGDNTFEAPVSLASGPSFASDIVLADLDADGHLDIVSCEFNTNTVTVVRSLGARSFASPVSSEVRPSIGLQGNPIAVAVFDATDDGKLDVVTLLSNGSGLSTLPGNGDGTFLPPQLSTSNLLRAATRMVVADFTGDGRTDVVTWSSYVSSWVTLMRNAPGELTLNIAVKYPTISTGQTESFTVYGYSPAVYLGPYPTGTVTVSHDGAQVASGALSQGITTLTATSLPPGTPSCTASYEGDSNYRPTVSAPVLVNVVPYTATVTLTDSALNAVQYGAQFTLSGDVTSPIVYSVYGSFYLYTDGQRSEYTSSGPPVSWYESDLLPGTHTFYVTYEGNANQPPGTSNVVTQVITKGDSIVSLSAPYWYAQYGQQPTKRIDLSPAVGSHTPGGALHVYEGRTLLTTVLADPTGYSGGMSVDFAFPVLPVGVHYLYATYDGNSNFNPSQSPTVKYTVLAASTLAIAADYVPSVGSITVWGVYSGATSPAHYVVHRRVNTDPWSIADPNAWSLSYIDNHPVAGNAYSFWIEALDSNNQVLATSNVDSVTMVSFTDDPVLPTTAVKALHLTELVNAVNLFRSAASLQPLVFADIAPDMAIRATHITALQNGLNQARAVLGSNAVSWAGGSPAAGQPIKAQHVQDLREAMR